MNDSQLTAQRIQEDINSQWPILATVTAADLDDGFKWRMNCAGFKPHVFTQREAVNKIYQLGQGQYFFVSVQARYLVMVDYWSDSFQFHGWHGASRHFDIQSPEERKVSELCNEYRYAA